MNISYKTDNFDLTDEITSYAEEKVVSLEKFIGDQDAHEAEILVELSKDEKHHSGLIYRADITVITAEQRTHAVGHGSGMKEALDLAKDELKRRLTRRKGRMMRLVRHGQKRIKDMFR
ncbi:MAG: ribosome-associated translation inhibitor RaiA [Minisyncoccia bacterium]